MPKKKLEYKAYYHSLVPFPNGLACFGSNMPDHPKGSCVNPKHSLAYPNIKLAREKLERTLR